MESEFGIPNLPPVNVNLESKKVLKKLIAANKALAELKGVANSIPNRSILINSLGLQEAKESSEIENIITTHDELFRAEIDNKYINHSTKEVANYRHALKIGFELVLKEEMLLTRHILKIHQILEENNAGLRKLPGTA